MSEDLSMLKMPKHSVTPDPDGGDFWHATEGTLCRSWRIPGYALMQPDGRLHCNRCGWVTPEPVITTYSPDTGKTYLTMEDLTSAEANGWVVVGTCTRPGTAPVVTGPYEDRDEARRAQARLRRKWRQDEERWNVKPGKVSVFIRPLWKEYRGGVHG